MVDPCGEVRVGIRSGEDLDPPRDDEITGGLDGRRTPTIGDADDRQRHGGALGERLRGGPEPLIREGRREDPVRELSE